jgi:hypothetical protein
LPTSSIPEKLAAFAHHPQYPGTHASIEPKGRFNE